MLITVKKRRQVCLSLVLCFLILGQLFPPAVGANDRSADIIGSRPLTTENIITATGLTGHGQIVGIADSGLDDGSMSDIHPDLANSNGSGEIPKVMLQSYTNRPLADDPDGHGTFMAATIAGTGAASQEKYRGIAPGASLYFQALLDRNGNIDVPEDAADLFLPAYEAGVRVHVNGWGNSSGYSGGAAQIDKFVYQHPTFLPIFSAGNNGPDRGTLTSQANSKNALVIGSSQVPRPAFDPEARFADQVAASSSRGPTADGRTKPDLLAPGSALISACSSLTDSNFAANPLYTRMGGSSMAAAVTGGALALLREQLSIQQGVAEPSAALMKALLINGARDRIGEPAHEGFGVLDLASTSLALKERAFLFDDSKTRLKQGENREYKLIVTDPTMPIKITLAWTDPAGNAGSGTSLVNNLNLSVRDPRGRVYYGNDSDHRQVADTVNNVEQVSITTPESGEYTIVIDAADINSDSGQDFALVYGQVLCTGIVQAVDGKNLTLEGGNRLDLNNRRVQQVQDGKAVTAGHTVEIGSDIYYNSSLAFIFGDTWEATGVQALDTLEGSMVLEMNNSVREGGYYIDRRMEGQTGSIMVNGVPARGIDNLPAGTGLKASVNPALQTLWKLQAQSQEVTGYISEIDAAGHTIKLLNNDQTYTVSRYSAISYRDKIIDGTLQEVPYSMVDQSLLDYLLPGTAVTLNVIPGTGNVNALFLQRSLIIGRIIYVDESSNLIKLDSGRTYSVFPGSSIYRDKESVKIGDLQAGDLIKAQLVADVHTIIQINASSQVTYGRVSYLSAKNKTLYLIDSRGLSRSFILTAQTEAFGMDFTMEPSGLEPGDWVRIIGDPESSEAWRIDVADIGEESTKILAGVDQAQNTIHMTDGSTYEYSPSTRVSRGGYIMGIEDLIPGEPVQITTLTAPAPWMQFLGGVEAKVPGSAAALDLNITAQNLDGVLVVRGFTIAERVFIYRQDGSRERIDIVNGNFERIFNLLEKEKSITVVALDTDTGAMRDIAVDITPYQSGSQVPVFTDINGHWAEAFITELATNRIVKGYEDGTFRPNNNVTRAELMVLLAQQQGIGTAANRQTDFADDRDIPWWARSSVAIAEGAGWINGYSDGTFRPYLPVTRRELSIVSSHLQADGLVNLFPGETLQPARLVTRAEVAAMLARL